MMDNIMTAFALLIDPTERVRLKTVVKFSPFITDFKLRKEAASVLTFIPPAVD